MMTCFAGGLLTAPLCGEPVLGALIDDPMRLCIATGLWWLIFYAPKDMVHKVMKEQKAVKLPLYIIKGNDFSKIRKITGFFSNVRIFNAGMYYPKKIVGGIRHAKYIFKKNILAGIVIATLKGNGSGIIKPFARLARY